MKKIYTKSIDDIILEEICYRLFSLCYGVMISSQTGSGVESRHPFHIKPDAIMKWYQVSVQNITKHDLHSKKLSEELDKNSDGNDSESDGDTDIDHVDHMNSDE